MISIEYAYLFTWTTRHYVVYTRRDNLLLYAHIQLT
jgi:hypothetical protein